VARRARRSALWIVANCKIHWYKTFSFPICLQHNNVWLLF
jgi:hypothetical protein